MRQAFAFLLMTVLCAVYAQRDQEYVLSEDLVRDKRLMVVGDVHGCFDEFTELLTEADMVDGGTVLQDDVVVVLAGDFVNKGPKTLDLIRWLMDQNGKGKAFAVAGNNEIDLDEDWINDATDDEILFLETLPYTISIPSSNVRVVHAGMMPNWPLSDQTEYIMTLMRNLEDDGEGGWIPHEETDDGENWATIYSQEQTDPEYIIYGHDARRGHDDDGNIVIQEHEYARGMDTRCVKGGELTGVMVEEWPFNTYHSVECYPYDPFGEN